MLRLPMHPRYARMLVEASTRNCVPAAALCAALVSGRDLLMRLGRDDAHLKEARELFEGSTASDFYTLLRAQQYAKNQNFSVDACRRIGIHAQTARQVDETYRHMMQVAERERLHRSEPERRRRERDRARMGSCDPPRMPWNAVCWRDLPINWRSGRAPERWIVG